MDFNKSYRVDISGMAFYGDGHDVVTDDEKDFVEQAENSNP